MDDLRIYILFNSIPVIAGEWEDITCACNITFYIAERQRERGEEREIFKRINNRALDKREYLMIFFLFLIETIGSDEGSQHMFLCRIDKYYP